MVPHDLPRIVLIGGVVKIADMGWIWEVLSRGLPLPDGRGPDSRLPPSSKPLVTAWSQRTPVLVPLFPAPGGNPETGLLPPPGQYDRSGDFSIFAFMTNCHIFLFQGPRLTR